MSEEVASTPVQVYVYDLSRGLARNYSRMFLGTEIEAIYHTSVVVRGNEYYIDRGIQTIRASSYHLKYGPPMEVIDVGETFIDDEIIKEFINDLNNREDMKYDAASYDLFTNNCNHFTDTFLEFLCDKKLDERILNLPAVVLETPAGRMLQQMIGGTGQLF
ncbi:hypothetical protein CANMA_004220 [Candida margitis]|uniref:uncharacterized protein n=1 Tax=Candida margitis TaxID=1775924 RepID=UPI0022262D03|nr:uncharacterized protein CANMA_004220 [Candida margitis]KAI5958440.1 hypothetical protein CANMA_004220 [Candida margitis]